MTGKRVTVVRSEGSGGTFVYSLSCGHQKTANFYVGAETDCLRCLVGGTRLEPRAPAPADEDAPVRL